MDAKQYHQIKDAEIASNQALNYLARNLNLDGFWREFEPRHGNSTYWTTSYIAKNLPSSSRLIKPALKAIRLGQNNDGGWSYNDTVPSDADSTANSLLFLIKNKVNSKAVSRGLDYLLKHQDKSGGFLTYTPKEFKQIFPLSGYNGRGWCSAHNDVTSRVLQALLEARADENQISKGIEFLLNNQEEGLWKPYWWTSPEYSTCHAVKALTTYGKCPEEVQKALETLESRQENGIWHDDFSKEESPFYTSLALKSLLLDYERFNKIIHQGIDYLLTTQKRNGSWESKPILRMPHPNISNPNEVTKWGLEEVHGDNYNSIFADKNACFTTATIRSCLQDYLGLNEIRNAEEDYELDETFRFFEPSILEVILGTIAIPFSSVPIGIMAYALGCDWTQALSYSLIPQATIYLIARAVDFGIFGKEIGKKSRMLKLRDFFS